MKVSSATNRLFHYLLLLFGVFCGSTAVILIKSSTEHPFLVASYRLLLAAGILFPFFLQDIRSGEKPHVWNSFRWVLPPAVFLAVHFMSWVIGARMTQVANASLIANLTPTAMPFFLWIFYKERVNPGEIAGTVLTITGLLIMVGSNLQVSRTGFLGDLICFGSMLAFAAYLALGRKNGSRFSFWSYIVPLYAISGLICLTCAVFFVNPIKSYTITNLLYFIGLAVIPTVLGHTILNYSLKLFRGQVVSVTNLGQPLFATGLGVLIFRELPKGSFYLAALMIITGVLVVLKSGWEVTVEPVT